MTRLELEDRVRRLRWPSPPDGLRARVIDAAAFRMAEAPSIREADAKLIDAAPAPRPQPIWRTAPVFLGIALIIVIAACTGLDRWTQHDLELELARLIAKYGSLDETTISVAPVPDNDNRARVVRAALELVAPIPGQRDHFVTFTPPSPMSVELRDFANANRDAIRILDDIGTRHQSNWELAAKQPPPWAPLQILSNAVYVTALVDIEAGRPDDAGRAIAAGLGVSASMRQEPGVVTMIRVEHLLPRQFQAIRRLVTDSTPSAAVLKDLAWWLAENRTPPPMQAFLLSQLKGVNAVFARMEQGRIDSEVAMYIYPGTWPDWLSPFLGPAAVIGRPFVRMARVRSLRLTDQLLDEMRGPRPRAAAKYPLPPQRWALVDRLVDRFTTDLWLYRDREDHLMSELAVAEVGVALRRYKLDRFDYPDNLSALAPSYIDRLPIDPYTGGSLAYVRDGSGFKLQAQGSNPGMSKYGALVWEVKK